MFKKRVTLILTVLLIFFAVIWTGDRHQSVWAVESSDVVKNGLYQNEDLTWDYYVEDRVDTEYTGLTQYYGTWYYVENGRLNWDYTGLTLYYGTWYYVEKGQLNLGYTGLTKYYDTWYHVVNGQLDWTYTNLTFYYGTWYYVENGRLNWTYTGLTLYYGTWYYVENGRLNWAYTGLTKYYDTWYHVVNGQLDWTYTNLTFYYGTWYYVENGRLNWAYTGLKEYYGTLYYIEKGQLDWHKNGTYYSGKNYRIQNGVASLPKVLTLGDSITEGLRRYANGTGDRLFVNTWPRRFETLYGGEVVNGAISGGAIVDNTFRSMHSQIKNHHMAQYDLIILAFGTNDFTLGTAIERVKTELRSAIQKIYAQNPNVKIVGILPHNVFYASRKWVTDGYVSPNAAGITLNAYCDAIKEVYDSFGIASIDWRTNPIVTASNRTQVFWDATHPNEYGLQLIGQRIYEFINGL